MQIASIPLLKEGRNKMSHARAPIGLFASGLLAGPDLPKARLATMRCTFRDTGDRDPPAQAQEMNLDIDIATGQEVRRQWFAFAGSAGRRHIPDQRES
jgi:hypothetical protein